MRGLVYMASRDEIDVDTFHKGIQYALERQGKSEFGFESTTVSNFKSKSHEGSGNELVDYSRTPCLGADQKERGLWERDWLFKGNEDSGSEIASIAFTNAFPRLPHCDAGMRRNQNLGEKVTVTSLGFSIFGIFFAFLFSFFFLFAAVIDLLLGLLAVEKLLRKRHRDGQILAWSSQVWWQEILLRVFHSTF